MKFPIVVLGMVCAACSFAVGQQPERDPGVEQKLRSLEYSKFDGLERRDNASLDQIFDNAMLLVDANGLLWNKADFLVKSQKSSVIQIVPEAMTVEVSGDVAIIVGIYRERGLIGRHPYLQRCRFIDTWTFRNGKWVCIASTATSTIS